MQGVVLKIACQPLSGRKLCLQMKVNKNIEENMRDIHCQFLLEKDKELTSKGHKEEIELLCQLRKMPNTTIEEQAKKVKAYEKFKKLIDRNNAAYKERQKEIDGFIGR